MVIIALVVVIIGITLVTSGHWLTVFACVVVIAVCLFFVARFTYDPDRLRARQSERTLRLATQTLPYMRQGLTVESAQEVCRLLLPATMANAVAITNREVVMGFAGAERDSHPIGSPIITTATLAALRDKQMQVLNSGDDIGFSEGSSSFKSGIVVPLMLHDEPVGVLKFYYRLPHRIDETQQAMAQGLGALLEMQLQLAELEQQREVASQMRIKALQAQINPHFLFNTINTIASLIRTNPSQARILLREFAKFYRSTLEGSMDLISLEQERSQTLRYLGFEIARFGDDRIHLSCDIADELMTMPVPAFILQPLVENAVAHGMRDDRPLHINIVASVQDGIVTIVVRDDGIGIAKDAQPHVLDAAREHAGVAMTNVDERLRSVFGKNAGLAVQSELGIGTTITLTLGHWSEEDPDSDKQETYE